MATQFMAWTNRKMLQAFSILEFVSFARVPRDCLRKFNFFVSFFMVLFSAIPHVRLYVFHAFFFSQYFLWIATKIATNPKRKMREIHRSEWKQFAWCLLIYLLDASFERKLNENKRWALLGYTAVVNGHGLRSMMVCKFYVCHSLLVIWALKSSFVFVNGELESHINRHDTATKKETS